MATRSRVARLAAGYGVIFCAVPYLGLKIVWLAGGQLGVADPDMMRDPSMTALNALTAGMDLVGIAIALAFTHRWGLRIPAWLVLPPMWVATGLLVRFVVAVPVAMIASALGTGAAGRTAVGPVRPWVYALVYTEFVGMGIGLAIAFVLYARARWSFVFAPAADAPPSRASDAVLVPLANTAALMAVAAGALHLAWASGARVGLPEPLAAQRTIVSHLINGIDGLLMLGAAAGILAIVHRRNRPRTLWLAVTLAWTGGGSLFAWGLWHSINVLGNTALIRERSGALASVNLAALVQLIAGLIVGFVLLVALAERSASTPAR